MFAAGNSLKPSLISLSKAWVIQSGAPLKMVYYSISLTDKLECLPLVIV